MIRMTLVTLTPHADPDYAARARPSPHGRTRSTESVWFRDPPYRGQSDNAPLLRMRSRRAARFSFMAHSVISRRFANR